MNDHGEDKGNIVVNQLKPSAITKADRTPTTLSKFCQANLFFLLTQPFCFTSSISKKLVYMRLIKAFAILVIAFSFSACQKDLSDIGGPDPIPSLPATPDPITARLQGNILDENGVPASGVVVKVGNTTVTTDTRGYFRIQNAALDKKSAVVTAEKAGYFKAYRTFAATSGTNQVIIKLIKKTIVGTVSATSGGSVTLSNGGKIVLPSNGVVKASDNSAFTGTINVYASYIDPTAPDIDEIVPGSFMADDKNGGRVTLASFGMMAVVLESTSGEKLQIKSGSVATLTTPVPASRLASAPATIPMWSVNEQTGIWKEEGTATLQGNVYVGDVKHFSFWNCDIPMSAIVLSVTVTSNNQPLAYSRVKITRQNPTQSTYGYTDSLGRVSGWVPANQPLVLELIDRCNNPYYSQNIGPFNVNSSLNISVPPANLNIITVTGRLLNCSNNPVTNGYARIYFGYYTSFASTDANGNFSTTFSSCATSPTTFDILGVDLTTMQQAVSTVAAVSPTTNAGNITVCGTSATQFLNYTVNTTNYSLGSAPSDSLIAWTSQAGSTTYTTRIMGAQNFGSNSISFSFNSAAQVPGTYPMATLSVPGFPQATLGSSSQVTITSFPTAPGQFYEGNFSAIFNGTNTASGTFKIRK
jgi:hypothetical protein